MKYLNPRLSCYYGCPLYSNPTSGFDFDLFIVMSIPFFIGGPNLIQLINAWRSYDIISIFHDNSHMVGNLLIFRFVTIHAFDGQTD